MKKNSPEAELERLKTSIAKSIAHWKDIRDNGCYDPCWEDGVNMNLVRNHFIYDKRRIREICIENGWELPQEAFVADLPKVSNRYFAKPDSDRAIRIRTLNGNDWTCIKEKKALDYDETVLMLF